MAATPDETVRVWSVLPHELHVKLYEVKGKGAGKTVVEHSVTIQSGDNQIDPKLWAEAKKRQSVISRIESGHVGEGLFMDQPPLTRDTLWAGERDAEGRFILTPPGTKWTRRLCPKAQSVTDANAKARAARMGIEIIDPAQLAGFSR